MFDYDSIELKSFTYGYYNDTGDLNNVGFSYMASASFITVANNEAGGINFDVALYNDLKRVYSDISLLPLVTGGLTCTASKRATGLVKIGNGLTTHCDKSDTGDYIDDESVGLLELLPAKADTLGGVKKANLNLQSEYDFLKAVPSVTTLDEAKFAINHLRIICKTLIDKLEEAGTLNK